jgi:DNA polymerase-3 subunit epsilon
MYSVWPHIKYLYLYWIRYRNTTSIVRNHLQGLLSFEIKRPIGDIDFVVFDTETTGLNARKGDRIVSISAIRIRNGRIDLSDAFHRLINPHRDIPPQSVAIHEILPRMVLGKPSIEEVLPDFVTYIGSSVLVAHQAWFDMRFLNSATRNTYGFRIQNIVLDTASLDCALSRIKAPRETTAPGRGLTALAERYHVTIEERHTSFGDALATAQILQQMIKEAKQFGMVSLKDLIRLSSK